MMLFLMLMSQGVTTLDPAVIPPPVPLHRQQQDSAPLATAPPAHGAETPQETDPETPEQRSEER